MSEQSRPIGRNAKSVEPAAPSARPSRARTFREILASLSGLESIRGGLMVTPDGLVIASELPPQSPVEALSALGATLGRELELGADRLGRGEFKTALFSADDGTVFVGGSPVGFLVLLADPNVDTASVLTALRQALDRLRT